MSEEIETDSLPGRLFMLGVTATGVSVRRDSRATGDKHITRGARRPALVKERSATQVSKGAFTQRLN